MYRICKVYKDENGKVQAIHTGVWPNIKTFTRVEIDGERFFKCAAYGKVNLYKPNKQTHCMEFVKKI